MEQREYIHLINRAGFGGTLPDLLTQQKKSRKEIVRDLFVDSAETDELALVDRPLVEDIQMEMAGTNGDTKKDYRKMLYEIGRTMNVGWLKKMIADKGQLAEKMTFFWMGHFACRDDNPVLMQQLNNVIRNNALGKFKDLLMAVSQSPAMLKFLNNQQNKKEAPNENFAREVMELFTLGSGNYTEQDIKEAARAFTGWSFDKETLNFKFNQNHHDYDEKEFFGKKGNFDGADILNMILYKEECARFITGKIYKFFVNEERHEARINDLAEKFYTSDYNIATLMEEIFMADWFYEDKNTGTRIKSPIELLVHISRLLKAEYGNEDTLVFIQKLLGQTLFLPPNVAGWPIGKRWIDSTSLVFRMDLGRKIIESSELNEKPKGDDDADPNMMFQRERQKKNGKLNQINATVNWDWLMQTCDTKNDEDLFDGLSGALLAAGDIKYSNAGFPISGDTKEQKLKSVVTYLMSRPEFQLC